MVCKLSRGETKCYNVRPTSTSHMTDGRAYTFAGRTLPPTAGPFQQTSLKSITLSCKLILLNSSRTLSLFSHCR